MVPNDWDSASVDPTDIPERLPFSDYWNEVLVALSQTNEQLRIEERTEKERLSVRSLRRDIRRCLDESQSVVETASGLWDFFVWKNPLATLCLFGVYLFCVRKEILIPTVLGMILFQLALNYLHSQRNIDIGLHFLPKKSLRTANRDTITGAQLVLEIARRVQTIVSVCADILEKWSALFEWQKPKVTLRFVYLVSFFFFLSVFFSLNTFLLVIGFLCGGKMFIMTRLYYRFPKLRPMFDIANYFYSNLPTKGNRTTEQWTERILSHSESMDSGLCSVERQDSWSGGPATDIDSLSEISVKPNDESETEFFLISRSCLFVDKSVPFHRNGVTAGTIFLTEKLLTFRYSKGKTEVTEKIEIPFDQIRTLKKIRTIRPFSGLLSPSTKGIELEISTHRKPIQLIGIQKRDDFYESLIEMARMADIELDSLTI